MIAILDLPSVYMLDAGRTQGYGMMVWFKISSFLTVIGQWGRYLAVLYYPDQFWITIIPAGIIALG